jgi:hypothetical protein
LSGGFSQSLSPLTFGTICGLLPFCLATPDDVLMISLFKLGKTGGR